MIVFQDLDIKTALSIEELHEQIHPHLKDGWGVGDARVPEDKNYLLKSTKSLVYSCSSNGARFGAALFLAESSDGVYYVSNICPQKDSPNPLTYNPYNVILNSFYSTIIRPLELSGVLTSQLSSEYYTIEQHLSAEAFRFLSCFAETANKSTCRGHPTDREWWQKFLIAVHSQQDRPDTEILGRWFIEEAGWEGWTDHVAELQDDYEFSMSLLSRFTNR